MAISQRSPKIPSRKKENIASIKQWNHRECRSGLVNDVAFFVIVKQFPWLWATPVEWRVTTRRVVKRRDVSYSGCTSVRLVYKQSD